MGRVTHFEIHATDPERAIHFYTEVLGWKFTSWGNAGWDYWLIETGPAEEPGINGGMIRRMGGSPEEGQAVNAYVCTVLVDDLDATVASATDRGATIALPRMPIPGVGWLAYVKDTEGNILGLMQTDETAK
jgi:predicted enzyme related to lactoylglutathione lyase